MSSYSFLFLLAFSVSSAHAATQFRCSAEQLAQFQSEKSHQLYDGDLAEMIYGELGGADTYGHVCFGPIHCHGVDNPYRTAYDCQFLANEVRPIPSDASFPTDRNYLSGNEAEELLWHNLPNAELTIYYEYPHTRDASCELRVRTREIECSYWDIDLIGFDDCDRLRKRGLATIEENVSKEKFIALYVAIPREITRSNVLCYRHH